MNIKYDANIGKSKMAETLTSTGDKFYYRTLVFRCENCQGEQVDMFTQFLDSKIELSKVAASSEAIVLVSHSINVEPSHEAIGHLITLIGARILSCESLHWGFVPHDGCTGYQFTIYLPTALQPITTDKLFDALKHNNKPSVERTEIKPTCLWDRLLVGLGVRKRRYSVVINGARYEV